ncbi:hypothetical protein OFM52_29295, partial [Escherichia coli]|nr:hypothetical protein [Escherichia coli]
QNSTRPSKNPKSQLLFRPLHSTSPQPSIELCTQKAGYWARCVYWFNQHFAAVTFREDIFSSSSKTRRNFETWR